MLSIESLKSDIACLKRVRDNLAKYHAGELALAIVDGMIDGNERTIETLEAEKEWLKAFDAGTKEQQKYLEKIHFELNSYFDTLEGANQ